MSDNKKTCTPFDHPNMPDGWSCCQCAATGAGTFNGNNRAECKTCGHKRCDAPSVKRIPVKEEGGVRIITVKSGGLLRFLKDKLN
jgi:hypothetical protein